MFPAHAGMNRQKYMHARPRYVPRTLNRSATPFQALMFPAHAGMNRRPLARLHSSSYVRTRGDEPTRLWTPCDPYVPRTRGDEPLDNISVQLNHVPRTRGDEPPLKRRMHIVRHVPRTRGDEPSL